MNITLQQIETFLEVAYCLSFSRAAANLRLPPTTVSSQISSLEHEIGFKLFKRTSRSVNLTPKGKKYKVASFKAFTILKDIQSHSTDNENPQGDIKISLPIDIPREYIVKLVKSFQNDFPLVRVELIFNDKIEKLIDENFDLAIRVGRPTQKEYICKLIGKSSFAFFATKEYISTNNISKVQKKNFSHVIDCHRLLKSSKCNNLLKTNNFEMAKLFAIKSMGISYLPNSLCKKEVETNVLQRLSTDLDLKPKMIYLVYPSRRLLENHVRLFINYVSKFDLEESF